MKNKKITAKSKLLEVLHSHPKASEIFSKNRMHCFGCALANFETIEDVAKAHGLDLKKLLEELNK